MRKLFVRTLLVNSVIAIVYFTVFYSLPKEMQGVPAGVVSIFSLFCLVITGFILLLSGGMAFFGTLYGAAVGKNSSSSAVNPFLNGDESDLSVTLKFFLFSLPFAVLSVIRILA
jgi:hypothetical protein